MCKQLRTVAMLASFLLSPAMFCIASGPDPQAHAPNAIADADMPRLAQAYNGPLFPGQVFQTGGAPFSVAIGDLDGDGRPDLAVANFASKKRSSDIIFNKPSCWSRNAIFGS